MIVINVYTTSLKENQEKEFAFIVPLTCLKKKNAKRNKLTTVKRAGRDAYHGGIISINLIGKLPEGKYLTTYQVF